RTGARMSAPGLKAAIVRVPCHVAEVPKADIQHMTSAAVEQGSWRARSLEFSRCSCAPLINRYSLKSLRHPVDLLLLSPLGERLSEGGDPGVSRRLQLPPPPPPPPRARGSTPPGAPPSPPGPPPPL